VIKTEHYDHNSEKEIENLLLGRRIVDILVRENINIEGFYDDASGVMTLDDGTKIYVVPHVGGCSCGAGDYALTSLAKVDNVITSVRLESKSDESDYDGDTSYRIYIVADAVEINAVQIDGNDGNGCYGTGYDLIVKKVS
jgi:hypothetical protein